MGLDMYLKREHYVKNWDHNPEEKGSNSYFVYQASW
jgi:hypothetical protein